METRTTAQWLELCRQHEVPCAPVRSLAELGDDPHLEADGFFEQVEHPSEGHVRLLRGGTRWSDTDFPTRHLPPRVGQDSVQVLADIGFSAAEIEAMLASGATMDASAPPAASQTSQAAED